MFQYYGNVEGLHEFLDRNRKSMRRAYEKVLGKQLFSIVHEAEAELIGKESFFETSELFEMGINPQSMVSKFMAVMTTSSKTKHKIGRDGHIIANSNRPIITAPSFVFSEEGLQLNAARYAGWVDLYGAGYIHEFNHFVIYALQERSLFAAIMLLLSRVKPDKWPVRPDEIELLAFRSGEPLLERQVAAYLALFACQLEDLYEFSTRQLDKAIFKWLGYRIPERYYPSEPRQYDAVFMRALNIEIVLPVSGDPLYGYSTKERLRKLSEWDSLFSSGSQFQENFVKSFQGIPMKKTRVTQRTRRAVKRQAKKDAQFVAE